MSADGREMVATAETARLLHLSLRGKRGGGGRRKKVEDGNEPPSR